MSGLQQLHDALLYMYAADATIEARADMDAGSTPERKKRLEELSMWLMEWRTEECDA